MDLKSAELLARKLMTDHELWDWDFQFDNARRRFGVCRRYGILRSAPEHAPGGLISLSRHLVLLNSEDRVRDTVLHEIAHALVKDRGHGLEWKNKAREVGAEPVRCYSEVVNVVQLAYQAVCPTCKHKFQRTRPAKFGRTLFCAKHRVKGSHSILNFVKI